MTHDAYEQALLDLNGRMYNICIDSSFVTVDDEIYYRGEYYIVLSMSYNQDNVLVIRVAK